jgi:hypothetical protein
MVTDKLRRLSYGWLVVQGLLATLAPKRSIDLNVRLWSVAFEDTPSVEPRDWYVRSTRAAGLGMIVTGVAGLLFERRATTGEEETADEAANEEEAFPFDPNRLSTKGWIKLGLSRDQARVVENYRRSGGRFWRKEELLKL